MTTPALHPSERAALRAAHGRTRWPVLAVVAAGVAVSTGSAFAMIDRAPPAPAKAPPRPAPIAAGVKAVTAPTTSDNASPAQGTTGTIALPPEPLALPAAAVPVETTIVPARAFSTLNASATDRGRALQCLAAAIYYEAASESDDGQRAVAQVVLNRVRHPVFPATVCGVVYQGSERASGCQFSFACDGAMARIPSRAGWSRAIRIAGAALAGQVYAPVGLATHYHTFAVTPAWNRTLVMTDAVGAHFFHRWKGYWGTAAAFSRRYVGGEPVPGPHAKLDAPAIAPVTIAVAMPATPLTPPVAIQPAYVAASVAKTQTAAARDTLPPPSQILDRWKDSGKPLR